MIGHDRGPGITVNPTGNSGLTAAAWLRELLSPSYCLLCGYATGNASALCTACIGLLTPNDKPCRLCGIPLGVGEADCCGQCLARPPPWRAACIPWVYDPLMARLVANWKYAGQYWLTPTLAHLWCMKAPTDRIADALVPVPLHWFRRLCRGYNQSELLARQLGSRLALPVPRPYLYRSRPTQRQQGLGALRRSRNLHGAFHASPVAAGQHVVLVDDVMTTGSTASAASRALLTAGAASVSLWCLARTPTPPTRSR